MNSFSNKKAARDHDESRAALCGLCMGKDKNLINITAVILDRIQKTVYGDYDLQNPVFPTSVCCSCRGKMFRLTKVCFRFFKTFKLKKLSNIVH